MIDLGVPESETGRMRCPRCRTIAAASSAACEVCAFHVSALKDALEGAPVRTNPLVDAAELLTTSGSASISRRLQEFTRGSGHDAVVVTLHSTGPLSPAEYAFGLFERWRVGGETRDGVMLFLTLQEGALECVLGQSLQPLLSPAEGDALLRVHAGPHLERQDIDAGLLHGIDMLARVFEHAEGLR